MSGLPLFGLLIGQNAMKRNRRPQRDTVKAANNEGVEVKSAEKPIPDNEQSPDILEEAENDTPTDLKPCDKEVEGEDQCDSEEMDHEMHSCDADAQEESDDTGNKKKSDDKENEHTDR